MAPGRRRGYKGAKTKSELSLGDLVLAKVKGFPAWPAKISRPEDWKHVPDPKKYFVQFFGTAEIAFVAPVDIQAFTSESKNKLSARCQGKTVKYFAQAVKEICEEFEELQCKNLGRVGDYNDAENLASETNSVDSVIGEASEVSVKNRRDSEEPNSKLETKETGDLDSALERCSETIGEMDRQNVKPCSSDDMNRNLSPQLSSRERIKPSTKSANPMKETNGDQGVSINGRQPKLAMEPKRKHDDAKRRNSDAVISREHNQDGVQIKHASGGNMKVSSADNSRSDSRIGSERKGKKLLKGKKHSAAADDGRVDTEVFCEDDNEVRKKMKFQHDQEKQASRRNEASLPLKMDDIEGNRLVSGGKAASRAQLNVNESKHSSDEDDLPPTKRQRRALGEKSNSTSISESRSGNSTLQKNGLVQPNKVQSPIMQLQAKRRAVRICDEDEDDELPKTPIHVGSTLKASVTPRVSDSKKKNVKRGETHENGHMVSRNTGRLEDEFKDQAQSSQISNKALSPTAQQRMEKNTPEILAKYVSSVPTQLVTEKIPLMEAKPVAVSPERSPRSATAARPLADPRKKQLSKTPGSLYQKKIPPGTNSSLGTASNRLNSSLNQSATERSKPTLSGEKKKTTPRPNYQPNDSAVSVGNTVESITSHGERLDGGKATKTNLPVDLAIPDSALSMKNLIAAAQARKRQANFHNPFANPLHLLIPDADMTGHSPSPTSAALAVESRNIPQIDVQGHPSPSVDVHLPSINGHENDDLEERRANSVHQATVSSLSGGTEAAVARDAFEGMIETLSRTKESIGRATRLAIDCAKYGIANEVVELLIRKLENEISFHRKVDLFFLVDSITQCSHSQKGIAGASYIPIVQAELPRLIGAAAPPGAGAQENRRQCQKVLRLWLERKILPESVLRRYVDDIGAVNDGVSAGLSQRRPSRAERAIDDPIREMEGMFVDEYGSNTTFQLPGLLSSHLFEEDDEDEDSFPSKLYKVVLNTSPSENILASKDPENCTVTPSDRRHCILEEVDGELEMEDVSGHDKDDRTLIANGKSVFAVSEPHSDVKFQSPSNISELLPSPEGSPPLPPGSPPTTPPLPNSPPPVSPSPPPPPPLPSSSAPPPPPPPPSPPFSQQLIPPPPIGPPPYLHSLPPQPVLMSQHVPPVPSTSKPLAYHPPPLHHDIGGTPSGNPPVHMLSSTQGSHTDAPRGELYSQQSSFFPAVAGSNAREQVGYNLSRPIEYSQTDAGISHQPLQQRQQMLPGTATFAQRPLHPDAPPQQVPGHFSYPNPAMQHQYPPYSLPVFSDGPRRYSSDEQWRMPVNDFNADIPSGGWNTGGYFVPPSERAPASAIFRPSPANSLPPAAPISVRGVPMMPCRPDMSAVNWRPA